MQLQLVFDSLIKRPFNEMGSIEGKSLVTPAFFVLKTHVGIKLLITCSCDAFSIKCHLLFFLTVYLNFTTARLTSMLVSVSLVSKSSGITRSEIKSPVLCISSWYFGEFCGVCGIALMVLDISRTFVKVSIIAKVVSVA